MLYLLDQALHLVDPWQNLLDNMSCWDFIKLKPILVAFHMVLCMVFFDDKFDQYIPEIPAPLAQWLCFRQVPRQSSKGTKVGPRDFWGRSCMAVE